VVRSAKSTTSTRYVSLLLSQAPTSFCKTFAPTARRRDDERLDAGKPGCRRDVHTLAEDRRRDQHQDLALDQASFWRSTSSVGICPVDERVRDHLLVQELGDAVAVPELADEDERRHFLRANAVTSRATIAFLASFSTTPLLYTSCQDSPSSSFAR